MARGEPYLGLAGGTPRGHASPHVSYGRAISFKVLAGVHTPDLSPGWKVQVIREGVRRARIHLTLMNAFSCVPTSTLPLLPPSLPVQRSRAVASSGYGSSLPSSPSRHHVVSRVDRVLSRHQISPQWPPDTPRKIPYFNLMIYPPTTYVPRGACSA